MTGSRLRPAFIVGLFLGLLVVALQGVQSEEELEVPPEDLCRPYIEKALKGLGTGSLEQISAEVGTDADKESHEEEPPPASEEAGEPGTDGSTEDLAGEEETPVSIEVEGGDVESVEETAEESAKSGEEADQSVEGEGDQAGEQSAEDGEAPEEEGDDAKSGEADAGTEEEKDESVEKVEDGDSGQEEAAEEAVDKSDEDAQADEGKSDEEEKSEGQSEEAKADEEKSDEESKIEEELKSDEEINEISDDEAADSKAEEEGASKEEAEQASAEAEADQTEEAQSQEEQQASAEEGQEESVEVQGESAEGQVEEEEAKESEEGEDAQATDEDAKSDEAAASVEEEEAKSAEDEAKSAEDEAKSAEEEAKSAEEEKSVEEEAKSAEEESAAKSAEEEAKSGEEETKSAEDEAKSAEEEEIKSRARREVGEGEPEEEDSERSEEGAESEEEPTPEEDLIQEIEVPENLRPRDHINQLLKLDEENEEKERAIQKIGDVVLRDLKRLYDNAIQPLESLYKYRDLSNRHFGDPEIFSKPLVLFMGPWSGGKSSIINYLLDIEYKQTSLRTGAEPSPAYFNILMHGEEEEILDGTQLAADWTFSGLQKFGQGLLDRLKGLRLDSKLLEKVNIVEIPGILEIRKQVQRLFPFNDACQWFIDRADIIFLVYDPSKLDVGPETEAILDQLKGREYQTRIILNKADQVKPEELMRVQGALIWNISPLMSSAEPPIMYSSSLWSIPYEAGAPTRLLYAQERAFLRDLRTAIDKRVEHKIASARRFAVRVRNHAKMVDCYLTTYYNHKSFFGNKKEISDKIIESPQDYHIYEGLSTLTNISRYDLPDPDVYRDFFRLNPLYDFQLLSSTCTYFRGCPINRLDVAIAYDLPELVGKYRKSVEQVIHEYETNSPPS